MSELDVPSLRFHEFSGMWEEQKIENFATVKGGKRIPKGYTLEEKNNGYPYIRVSDMENNTVSLNDIKYVPLEVIDQIKNYKITTKDIFISVAGTLGTVGIIPDELNNANLTENANKLTNLKCNQSFLLQILNSSKLSNQIKNVTTIGAQPKLAIYAINNFKFTMPNSQKEQQKIASFLTVVDSKIEQLNTKQTLLQDYKKGVMQQIFSQEIRFKADDGSEFFGWEEKKLGEVFKQRTEKNGKNMELLSVTMNDGIKKRSDLEGKDNSSKDKSNYRVVYKNDIAYNSMRMWQGANGVSNYNGIVSPAYTVLKSNAENSSNYFAYLFKTKKMTQIFQRNSQGLTSDTWNLKYPQLSTIKLTIPSLKEQTKIANFLSSIDSKIEQVQKQLDSTKEFKKALLQQMFV